ncbi:hypothetical protein GCM10023143_23720 [Compostibacter hankyongensis]|uniref:PKD domain-containing protein n=2 Tax=Compostibacter hankyongensis TaxID=1007089 RepID=A0ABP8FY74_9BACT
MFSGASAQGLSADFTADQVSGCAPVVVQFSDQSAGNPTQWKWDFGNGNTAVGKNPAATYSQPGTYTVSLTISDGNTENTVTKAAFITVYAPPTVSFRNTPAGGCYPLEVNFTDESVPGSGTIRQWTWDFDDGSTSSEQHPVHTYMAAGNYNVKLLVRNSYGCTAVLNKKGAVRVSDGVRAGFRVSDSVSCAAPFAVKFTDTSTGTGTLQYHWDFGDGSTSASASPTHTYTQEGRYTVSLRVSNETGCTDMLVRKELISIGQFTGSFSVSGSCAGRSLVFKNTSSPLPDVSDWDFGDGATARGNSVRHTFARPGTYTVRLVDTYGNCKKTITKSITVSAPATAAFDADHTTGCSLPFTVRFSSQTANAASYRWDFGDGGTSEASAPAHSYQKEGAYTVTLVTANREGCTDTLVKKAYIRISKPKAGFSADLTKGCVPLTVHFTDTSAGGEPITDYSWDFGDGSTGKGPHPAHTYTTEGDFTVRLIATTAGGCRDTVTTPRMIRTGKKPVAGFNADILEACQPTPIHFTNTSQPAGDAWQWFFPDDKASESGQNPTHVFHTAGKQDVMLVVSSRGCADTLTRRDMINIRLPIARMKVTRSCDDRYAVTFADGSTGGTAWRWDFGDGTVSDAKNPPSHRFPHTGTYQVKLVVTEGSCNSTATQTVYVSEEHPVLQVPDGRLCRGEQITLQAAGIAHPELIRAYAWLTGDGRMFSGTQPSVSYAYTQNGTFPAQVITTDVNGCRDTSAVGPVIVSGPQAGFTVADPSACPGTVITFRDDSRPAPEVPVQEWTWDFGDGQTTTLQSGDPVQHTYPGAGKYEVTLRVKDAEGCTDSLVKPEAVNIFPAKADFVVEDTLVCPGQPLRWINRSQGAGATYHWDFGDGTGSDEKVPSKSYSRDGIYTVQLSVTTADGCTDTLVRKNYIKAGTPKASFSYSDNHAECPPLVVQLKNTSQNYRSITWDFDDGSTSTLENPEHIYNIPGTYRLKLRIEGYGGCADSVIRMVKVAGPFGVPRSDYDVQHECSPLTVKFSAKSVDAVSFRWDFGDGNISPESGSDAASHTYSTPGIYHPQLILKDRKNCQVAFPLKDTVVVDGAIGLGIDPVIPDPCDSGHMRFSRRGLIISADSLGFPVGYTWDFGDGSPADTSAIADHHYREPGTYRVTLRAVSAFGCAASAVLAVRVPEPQRITAWPADTSVCEGTPVTLHASGTPGYRWSPSAGLSDPSAANPVAVPEQSTTYQVTGYNAAGCPVDSAELRLTIWPAPEVHTDSMVWTVPTGSSVRLSAGASPDVVSWRWTPPDELNCTTCPDPLSTPTASREYQVKVANGYGCTDTALLRVNLVCESGNVFIPNTFSPNKDGNNDLFYPRGRGVRNIVYFRIFNRWGQKVFERDNFGLDNRSAAWDGTFNGHPLNPDVFIYQAAMVCDDGQLFYLQGDITLLR